MIKTKLPVIVLRNLVLLPHGEIKLEISNADDKNIIDNIVENKRSLTPWEIAKETSKITGAWSKVYDNGKGRQHIIPVGLIKELD